ncbi:MAG: UDP-N-acetylmuramate dehydrogenase [Muribaculaceae bacterium]|nr:UDP-N-acetylmuramate dehydrogenase [Muribaculaceae bacterium]
MTIEHDKDLTHLTTFKVPATASLYAEYENEKQLLALSRTPEFIENEVLHIGAGSNLLFMDSFKGLVLHSGIKGISEYCKDEENVFVIAGAGVIWTDLVEWCIAHDIAGLENMAGIPGEVGASAVQNVGAYGAEAGDFIHTVECFDTDTRTTVVLKNEECHFGYRDSIFKHEGKGKYIVLRVSFHLRRGSDARNLTYEPLQKYAERIGHTPTLRELADEVVRLRAGKLPDPALIGSAGSFFKNPVIHRYFYEEEIETRGLDLSPRSISKWQMKLSAAQLIDRAGLKGFSIGGAEVWPSQPLVIANIGGASAKNVADVADHVVRTVRDMFGISLVPEVNYIDQTIKITILGSGTSKGVPEMGCTCETCRSDDPRDKRLRASILVETHGLRLLIDASPDLRQQALRHDLHSIDAVLLTHQHYDHVGGIDDLRPFCADRNMPIYANAETASDLRKRLDYCFREHRYPGVPGLDLHEIGSQPFRIDGLKIIPVNVMHGKLPVLGYRIGDFAYLTDVKTIPESEKEKLTGLDVLIINCLRIEKEHFAHLILHEALALIEEIMPRRCFLTHASHKMGRYVETATLLPEHVKLAFDNQTIIIK